MANLPSVERAKELKEKCQVGGYVDIPDLEDIRAILDDYICRMEVINNLKAQLVLVKEHESTPAEVLEAVKPAEMHKEPGNEDFGEVVNYAAALPENYPALEIAREFFNAGGSAVQLTPVPGLIVESGRPLHYHNGGFDICDCPLTNEEIIADNNANSAAIAKAWGLNIGTEND